MSLEKPHPQIWHLPTPRPVAPLRVISLDDLMMDRPVGEYHLGEDPEPAEEV